MSSAATQLAFGPCSLGFRFPSAGSEHSSSAARYPLRRAFTLIELILVMAILTMAVSITAPALSNFFRGRTLDSEARRLLALTRGGQNRAVSEGIPIDLWVNPNEGIVGLDAEPSFETVDPKAVEFKLDSGVQIAVVTQPLVDTVTSSTTSASRFQPLRTASASQVKLTHPAFPTIRFLPDGTVTETSPRKMRLTGRDGISLWVAQTQDKLTYEIQRTDK